MSVGMMISIGFFAFAAFLAVVAFAWVMINKSRGIRRRTLK
jgi:hypothetical protein